MRDRPGSQPGQPGAGTFAALREPGFGWFLTGTTLTNTAHWIQQAMTLFFGGVAAAIALLVFSGSPTIRDYSLRRELDASDAAT